MEKIIANELLYLQVISKLKEGKHKKLKKRVEEEKK
nr:MAG: hypothetical protein [Bacteriophage sp.]